jgi:hypothetical protein
VAFVRTEVSEERIGSIIRAKRISELNTSANSFHPDDGSDTFLGNVGIYKSHTA